MLHTFRVLYTLLHVYTAVMCWKVARDEACRVCKQDTKDLVDCATDMVGSH